MPAPCSIAPVVLLLVPSLPTSHTQGCGFHKLHRPLPSLLSPLMVLSLFTSWSWLKAKFKGASPGVLWSDHCLLPHVLGLQGRSGQPASQLQSKHISQGRRIRIGRSICQAWILLKANQLQSFPGPQHMKKQAEKRLADLNQSLHRVPHGCPFKLETKTGAEMTGWVVRGKGTTGLEENVYVLLLVHICECWEGEREWVSSRTMRAMLRGAGRRNPMLHRLHTSLLEKVSEASSLPHTLISC